jgi:hypothetical protein
MLNKILTDALVTILPIVVFVILALYLFAQDSSTVGPL